VLVDDFNEQKNTWIGRNFAYKPVVLKGSFSFGQVVDAKIAAASNNSLFAG